MGMGSNVDVDRLQEEFDEKTEAELKNEDSVEVSEDDAPSNS